MTYCFSRCPHTTPCTCMATGRYDTAIFTVSVSSGPTLSIYVVHQYCTSISVMMCSGGCTCRRAALVCTPPGLGQACASSLPGLSRWAVQYYHTKITPSKAPRGGVVAKQQLSSWRHHRPVHGCGVPTAGPWALHTAQHSHHNMMSRDHRMLAGPTRHCTQNMQDKCMLLLDISGMQHTIYCCICLPSTSQQYAHPQQSHGHRTSSLPVLVIES